MHTNEPVFELQHDLHADADLETKVPEARPVSPQKVDCRTHWGVWALTFHLLMLDPAPSPSLQCHLMATPLPHVLPRASRPVAGQVYL